MKREAANRNVVIDDKRREVLIADGSRPLRAIVDIETFDFGALPVSVYRVHGRRPRSFR